MLGGGGSGPAKQWLFPFIGENASMPGWVGQFPSGLMSISRT